MKEADALLHHKATPLIHSKVDTWAPMVWSSSISLRWSVARFLAWSVPWQRIHSFHCYPPALAKAWCSGWDWIVLAHTVSDQIHFFHAGMVFWDTWIALVLPMWRDRLERLGLIHGYHQSIKKVDMFAGSPCRWRCGPTLSSGCIRWPNASCPWPWAPVWRRNTKSIEV